MEIQTIPPTVEEYRERIKQLERGAASMRGITREVARSQIALVVSEAVAVHGKPNARFPECEVCLRQSVFPGGPSHVASSMCRSGKRPHCSCDMCF